MKNKHLTKPRNMNNPQHTMATHGGGPVKPTDMGKDLSRDATNVIEKLGHNPSIRGKTAVPQNK